MNVRLRHECLEGIEAHGHRTYPDECCGILLGGWGIDGERRVEVIHPVNNARTDSPRNRYLIPPEEVLRVSRESEKRGLEIVGFYHSHPDVEPRPSSFDREHAWPAYVYLIVRVEKGASRETRAWELREDREEFNEVRLIIQDGSPATAGNPEGA